MSIENAASAFEATMNPNPTPNVGDKATDESAPVERLFDANFDTSEEAGGDDQETFEEGDGEEDDEGSDETEGAEDEAGDEDPDADGDDDADDEDDEGSAELDPNALVEVKIDGEPAKIPLKEALEGYIRTETFHKRLNEVQTFKQEVEKQAGEIAQARELYVRMLDGLGKELDAVTPKEPDWDAEFAKDPAEAGKLKYRWDKYKEQRAQIDRERDAAIQEQQREAAKNFQQFADAQREEMLTRHPEWKDPANWDKVRTSMKKTAMSVGFTEEELKMTVDSRYVEILHKAAQWDRLQAVKAKANKGAKRTTSTGARPMQSGPGASRTVPKTVQKAQQRLNRTGDIHDAVSVFAGVLQSEARRTKRR